MASPKEKTFYCGPFKGVRTTREPFDDQSPELLATGTNVYFPDPQSGCSAYARPGFSQPTSVAGAANGGQAVYNHTADDGTNYNFVFSAGKVFRWSTDLTSTPVDVTPVGVTIAAGKFVYVTSLNDSIIVNDGVNEPWIGTSLGSTPIIGTYIDYDGAGVAWSAFGQPVVYTGAVFFILNTVGGVSARTTIAWSEPNQPAVGYQQTDYDNAWTLTQTGSSPLYALAATNEALYYSRDLSWGAITGAPNINFRNTATHDVVSANVGCVTPATVKTFLNYIYFCDANGRPYRFAVGGAPEPIWLQARGAIDSAGVVVTPYAWAVIEPNLNMYLAFAKADSGSSTGTPTSAFTFDANTGRYTGGWTVGGPVAVDIGGLVRTALGAVRFAVLQQSSGGTANLHYLNSTAAGIWQDGGSTAVVRLQTGIFGFDGARTLRVGGQVRVLQESGASVNLIVQDMGTGVTGTLQNLTRAPNATGGFGISGVRVVFSVNTVNSRGVQLLLTPTTTTEQWICHRVEMDAVEGGLATVEDF